MKTIKTSILFLIIGTLINGCSTSNKVVSNNFIQKRKYTKGYHINNSKVKINSISTIQQEDLLASTSTEENTYFIPKYKLKIASIFKKNNLAKKEIELRSGTHIDFQTTTMLSSKDKGLYIGKEVELIVSRDVKEDGQVLIERDARAYATVTALKNKKGCGVPGEIGIKIDRVTAVDGQTIYLSGEPLYVEGEDAKTGFWVALVIYILFLLPLFWIPIVFVKGKDAIIYPSTRTSARTTSDVDIEID